MNKSFSIILTIFLCFASPRLVEMAEGCLVHPYPEIILSPSYGISGYHFSIEVVGNYFASCCTVDVTVGDILVLDNILVDSKGSFKAYFTNPVTETGNYTVAAVDRNGKKASASLLIIDRTPLDVQVNVGSIHFRGELAEFYVLTAHNGYPVNATINNAILYYSEGNFRTDLARNATRVALGLYRIPYAIPINASEGTYLLLLNASYSNGLIRSNGISATSFLLSRTLTGWNARLVDIIDGIAAIRTDTGMIQISLKNINATVMKISGTSVTVWTEIGEIKAELETMKTFFESMNLQILEVKGDIAVIKTDVGLIRSDFNVINATIMYIEEKTDGYYTTIDSTVGNLELKLNSLTQFLIGINASLLAVRDNTTTIETDLGVVTTHLDAINAKITSLDGNLATVESDIGTIKTDLSNIDAELVYLNGNITVIKTVLGTINGTIVSIQGDIVTIMTDIGTIKLKLETTSFPWQYLAIVATVSMIVIASVLIYAKKVQNKS